ncbi:transcription termination factor 3, mitochondrial-like [Gigantopelta aegis]|uniref:transcription termination factor 3, mitochondrial-like n=1 Tax=Gigantopelta aegis TaxID=1735272 RepID=UPI001B887C39|nr:transcription termination factor 3, mitochondrial-like [Gigantopelta aegis]XP_041360525.1 transcription termination factor 3, mitochondrial-like [Gigantopelta aegis]
MAGRAFTLHYGRHFYENVHTKYSIVRFFSSTCGTSAVLPTKHDKIACVTPGLKSCENLRMHNWNSFEKIVILKVGTSGYKTFSFLQTCYREFHFATTLCSSDPVCTKRGITKFVDADDNISADSKPHVNSSESCYGNDVSFILHPEEEPGSSFTQNHCKDVVSKPLGGRDDDDSMTSLQSDLCANNSNSEKTTGSHGNHYSTDFTPNELDVPEDQEPSGVLAWNNRESAVDCLRSVSQDRHHPEIFSPPLNDDQLEIVPLQQKQKSKLLPVHNLAALVDKSASLSELVKLGVDLSEVEKVDGAADMIAKLDFENDIRPYLLFLSDVGVPGDRLGHYLSKNPLLLEKEIPDLQSKIGYLESKRFTPDAIARIVCKCYVFLVLPLKMVDAKLGYLQTRFQLTGSEVRSVVTRLPKLIAWKTDRLMDTVFYMKEFLGFSESEIKEILLAQPKVFLTNKYSLGKKFDYLHNVMGMDHKKLVQWPNIFRTRLHLLQQRHGYLESVSRAQYDPATEHYISLKALVGSRERDFCEHLAKTTVSHYRNYLKTL